ncbi:MAG: efflux RND transporter periplasmic adaptor subunit [Crocinitomicaceae bacterium]|nr:efflux RND transporter periplasmic adaptor subunit [Crocinitomicaceae bacterium]MBK8924343.1 efflux RND transporter periplasmic adaptor subunit [Crocinitomicaceae bacterium]
MRSNPLIALLVVLVSCSEDIETTQAVNLPITESVYASGIVVSKDQYDIYPNIGGIIDEIFVKEGDTIHAGQAIMKIYNEVQELNRENAMLAADYSDINANKSKLNDAKLSIELAKDKMLTDSVLYQRQINLHENGLGSDVELEQSQLNYHNSKVNYYAALSRYDELNRQINFNSAQSKKNLQISSSYLNDLTVTSRIDGIVYSILRDEGEMVNQATPVATIGDAGLFFIELQIDERDITRIQPGQKVYLTLDSYPDEIFEAEITSVNPILNPATKTFTANAVFISKPDILYPNMNAEANIVVMEKDNALLIPRNFVYHDSLVINQAGDTIKIETGLKDFKMIEILSGISASDIIQKPAK